MKERPPTIGELLRFVIETCTRGLPYILGLGVFQGVALAAGTYGAVHFLLYRTFTSVDEAPGGADIGAEDVDDFLHGVEEFLLLLLAAWTVLTVLRAACKFLAAVLVESGPHGLFRDAGQVAERYFTVLPLFVLLFVFTRPLTFFGYFIAGLPGVLMLSFFSLLAPLTAYGGWNFRRVLKPLDALDSERIIKLFVIYVLVGVVYLALPAAALAGCYTAGVFNALEAAWENSGPSILFATPVFVIAGSVSIAFSLGDILSTVAVAATLQAYRRADEERRPDAATAKDTVTEDKRTLTKPSYTPGPYD